MHLDWSTFDEDVSIFIVDTDKGRLGEPNLIHKFSSLVGWAIRERGIGLVFVLGASNRDISFASVHMVGLATVLASAFLNGDVQNHATLKDHHRTPE